MRRWVFGFCLLMPMIALAADERAEALAAFQDAAQQCKSSPTQRVSVELESVPGKPPSEPATPDELARVKDLLAKSGMPFDLRDHRASYEFVLALIRARNAAVFHVASTDAKEDLTAVRDCLAKLASSGDMGYRFEP